VSGKCIGYYYLHTDGALLFKRELPGTHADLMESSFVKAFWSVDPSDRECAWRIILDSLALAAREDRVFPLADKWGCNAVDAEVLLGRLGLKSIYDAPFWLVVERDFVDSNGMPFGTNVNILRAIVDFAGKVGGTVSTAKYNPCGIIDCLKRRAAERGTI
jgi:hypothetical protein